MLTRGMRKREAPGDLTGILDQRHSIDYPISRMPSLIVYQRRSKNKASLLDFQPRKSLRITTSD